jgi:hypothetical protein
VGNLFKFDRVQRLLLEMIELRLFGHRPNGLDFALGQHVIKLNLNDWGCTHNCRSHINTVLGIVFVTFFIYSLTALEFLTSSSRDSSHTSCPKL